MEPWNLEDGRFVPLYRVHFFQGQNEDDLAVVEVLEPERSLIEFSVKKPEYIHRRALAVPNREKLLSHAPASR